MFNSVLFEVPIFKKRRKKEEKWGSFKDWERKEEEQEVTKEMREIR